MHFANMSHDTISNLTRKGLDSAQYVDNFRDFYVAHKLKGNDISPGETDCFYVTTGLMRLANKDARSGDAITLQEVCTEYGVAIIHESTVYYPKQCDVPI
jgi:hypothetical protein